MVTQSDAYIPAPHLLTTPSFSMSHTQAHTDDTLFESRRAQQAARPGTRIPAFRLNQSSIATHTRDYNNNGSRMQPQQREAFHASAPWPPKDAPVAVTGQQWRGRTFNTTTSTVGSTLSLRTLSTTSRCSWLAPRRTRATIAGRSPW